MNDHEHDTDGGDARAPKGKLRDRLTGISIHWLLSGVIGGTVLAAMVAIYFLGLTVATENTRVLMQIVAKEAVDKLERTIANEVTPAADAARFGARQVLRSGPPVSRLEIDVLRAALAQSSQLTGGAYFNTDGSALQFPGSMDDPDWSGSATIPDYAWYDWREDGRVVEAMEQMRRLPAASWNEPILNSFDGTPLLIARHPIIRNGVFEGVFAVAVKTTEISRLVGTFNLPGATPFVLFGKDRVIAHPAIADGVMEGLTEDNPLPGIADMQDPILTAFANDEGEPLWLLEGQSDVFGRAFDLNEREFIVLWRRVIEYGPTPWIIGVHIDVDREGSEELLERLLGAAVLGLAIILVTLLVLHLIARRIRKPMQALAALSNRVRSLDFGVEKVGEPSIVREINEANLAFGRMLAGLRWFETYVPKNLVLTLMHRGEGSEVLSEERMVTVMFTDIAGFTTFSETRTPEDLANLLNTHFTLINQCVETEAGTVDKYIGDSVMAFWGAPEEQPDHAARACRAVVAVAADLAAYNAKRRARGREPIRMRIGLHSGPAVAGNIGSPGRINYTLVGDTVNVANRLEQLGKTVDASAECMILASDETRALAGDAAVFEFAGKHQLRGRSGAMPVYRMMPTA